MISATRAIVSRARRICSGGDPSRPPMHLPLRTRAYRTRSPKPGIDGGLRRRPQANMNFNLRSFRAGAPFIVDLVVGGERALPTQFAGMDRPDPPPFRPQHFDKRPLTGDENRV